MDRTKLSLTSWTKTYFFNSQLFVHGDGYGTTVINPISPIDRDAGRIFRPHRKTGIINLSDKNNARLLKHYIEEDININLHEQRGDNNIFLVTNQKLKESLGAEGYRMNISADSIVIEGAENAGVFTESKHYGS